MVQPLASTADLPMWANPDLELKLIKVLKQRKNDRPYVVLEYHATWASVHFQGDDQPVVVPLPD